MVILVVIVVVINVVINVERRGTEQIIFCNGISVRRLKLFVPLDFTIQFCFLLCCSG